MTSHRIARLIGAAGIACAVAAVAHAGPMEPTVIYSELAGDPTSSVPGLPGATFQAFDRPYVSQDGNNWIISADTDLTTSQDEIIIVGSGMTGTVVVQEGVTALPDTSLVGLIDRNMGIDNAGNYAFSTNTNGPTTSDESVVRYNATSGMFEFAAQEGGAVPGFPTESYGASLDSAGLTNDGVPFFRATSTVGSLPATEDSFLIHGNTIVAQEGVTIPAGQAGGAMETWQTFDFGDFYVTSNGANSVIQGDLNGADTSMDDVVVVNNQVRIQESNPINGVGKNVGAISETTIGGSSWFSRGDYDDDQDWLVMNGNVIAESGDPVPGGLPGETFSDAIFTSTFFTMTGNNNGDFVYGGTTDNPNEFADAVLVVNNDFVLLRQGDAVDVDGDGILDDYYLDIFNNDDMFLTDSGMLYFTAQLTDETGANLGQAFLTIQIPAPGVLGALGLFAVAGTRRRR